MPSSYMQATRPLTIRGPFPEDAFVVMGMEAQEAISDIYRLEVDVATQKRDAIHFDELLGKDASLLLERERGEKRFFSGIVCAVEQGRNVTIHQDGSPHEYTRFRLSMVPRLWLLSRRRESRIFQRQTVPEILKTVLKECNADFHFTDQQSQFHARDYCVQYRETNLDFARRLMEEEGIFFFFRHTEAGHRMIVTNDFSSYSELAGAFLFELQDSMKQEQDRIYSWRKKQEIQAGRLTLRDFHFEMPGKNLEEMKEIQGSVQAGTVTHKLNAGGAQLEIYDYPGGYAGRYDGVAKDGGDQTSELQNIFTDARRAALIAMQAEAAAALRICGESSAHLFAPGSRFQLSRHSSDNGAFVLTSVEHSCRQPIGTDAEGPFEYRNTFRCIPAALPFRSRRITPAPIVHGTQSATVVGPSGEEIFTDKYGRVKVQFHWDREGKSDSSSSCWVRIATSWAGKNWGAVHIPRVGQEVIVAFEEGDPNQPIIVGAVYNADNMPPYALPDNKTQSGVKSRSTPNASGSNELRFEDKHGSEEVFLHAEKDLISTIEHDETRTVKNDRTTVVTGNETKTVQRGDEKITLDDGSQTLTISKGSQKVTLSMGNQTTSISLGKSETEAMQSIELKVGESSVKLDQSGVTIKGLTIRIEAQIEAELKGIMTHVKGDGMLIAKGGLVMIN
ncbi:MAG TPA: type VI secretion system tip protein TssI/VgrG [Bryobacteraceae bacterium]